MHHIKDSMEEIFSACQGPGRMITEQRGWGKIRLLNPPLMHGNDLMCWINN